MSNSLTLGRRVFAAIVAAVTILSTVGLAAFMPTSAHAIEGADPGDNVKGNTLSTVYYYGYDGSRYTYPNLKTYETWFDGFSSVQTISDAELADLPLANNVVYRPGARWIKITSDVRTYAVARDGMIHWIESESVATDFAGSDWNTNIDDVPDVFFVDYTAGASLMTATAFDGMMYMDGGNSYVAWDGDMRMVTAAGKDGNDMEDRFFLDGAGINDAALASGSDVTGHECDLQDAGQTGCVEAVGGQLTVALASSSPASTAIPNTSTGVHVATYRLTAGDAVTLDSLSVELMGLAATTVIATNGVYLYEGNARLTNGKSINSSTRKATFAGLSLEFAAGQTREIKVLVDLGGLTQVGGFTMAIPSSTDVMTNGTVGGSFPIVPASHSLVPLQVGAITIAKTGSLVDPTLGQQDATVAKFNLAAGTAEDVSVQRVTLEIEDAADHGDFQIYQGASWLASGQAIGNDLVLFDFGATPYFIESGEDEDLHVTADVGGQAAETILTHLENAADLHAVGADYGFGVGVTRTTYDEGGAACAGSGAGNDCSYVTIQGGDITLAFNGPPADDVLNDAQDVTFFDLSMTSERLATVRQIGFDLTGTDLEDGTDTALADIRLVDCTSGSLVAGPEELSATGGNTQAVVFTDDFVIDTAETLNLCVTGDIDTTVADAADAFTFTLDNSDFDIEDGAGDAITDIVPSTDLAGNAQTVQDPSLTLSLASSPTGNTNYVKGENGALTAGFNFAAGTASDIEVTDATVTVHVDEDGGGTFVAGVEGTTVARDRISSCSLYDAADDSLIAGPESPNATTGEMVFDGFSWTVPAGDTEKAEVRCNLANVNPGTADIFAFEIDTATDVSAEDEEGSTVTPTGTPNSTEAVTITINNVGTLDLTAGGDVPDAGFVLTGSSSNLVSSFRFDANNEAFRINRLTVVEEQGEDDDSVANSDRYANNISAVQISYPKEDGTTGTASGALTGNERTFNLTSGNEIFVPKDDNAEVDVLVNVAVTDRSGGSATSNERMRMGLSVDGTNDDQFRALGVASNTTLNDDSSDGAGPTAYTTVFPAAGDLMDIFRVRETAPTITLSASTPSGSGFVPGDQEVLRVNVAANSGEDVVLRRIMFNLAVSTATNYQICDANNSGAGDLLVADFDFYNRDNLSTALDDDAEWALYTSDGTVCTDDTDLVTAVALAFDTDAEQEIIPAGTTYTYSLYLDTTGLSGAADDSIQVSVAGDPVVGTYLAASDLNEANLQGEDTTLTVTTSAGYTLGDVLCMDTADDACGAADEKMLLTKIVDGTTIEVVRGYLGTTPDTGDLNDAADDIDRVPGALLWQDDGSKAVTTSYQEYYGADLVNDLPMTGSNAMSF